jgi:hypothetical protein
MPHILPSPNASCLRKKVRFGSISKCTAKHRRLLVINSLEISSNRTTGLKNSCSAEESNEALTTHSNSFAAHTGTLAARLLRDLELCSGPHSGSMNPVLIFLIALVVLGLFFFVGEWNSEEERSAGIRQRFVLNLATVLLGLLGLVLWWINMLVRRKVLPEEHRKSPE